MITQERYRQTNRQTKQTEILQFPHALIVCLVPYQMPLGGTSCEFTCPKFSHPNDAVTREKGLIAVEARTNVEVEQVR